MHYFVTTGSQIDLHFNWWHHQLKVSLEALECTFNKAHLILPQGTLVVTMSNVITISLVVSIGSHATDFTCVAQNSTGDDVKQKLIRIKLQRLRVMIERDTSRVQNWWIYTYYDIRNPGSFLPYMFPDNLLKNCTMKPRLPKTCTRKWLR